MHAKALRQQIEQTLSSRVVGALSPRLRRASERVPTGIAELDRLLSGGLPVGAISEFVGPVSSGHTAIALSFTAALLQEGQVASWVDASDTLDPESAAALGVPLNQLLWVRCGNPHKARPTRQEFSHDNPQDLSLTLDARDFSVDRSVSVPAQAGGGGSPHPRSEVRGLPEAVERFISEVGPPTHTHIGGNRGLVPLRRRDRSIGTPGAANRSLSQSSHAAGTASSRETSVIADEGRKGISSLHWRSPHREEQVATDRLPARRGDQMLDRTSASWSPRCAESQPKRPQPVPLASAQTTPSARKISGSSSSGSACAAATTASKVHSAAAARVYFQKLSQEPAALPRLTPARSLRGIDQALRAVDLLLQAGGFGVIVLDLASIAPEIVWRIPLSTWFRFRAAAERSRACLLLLTQHPCTRSSAELVIELQAGGFVSSGSVVTGIRWNACVTRERFAPSPPANSVIPIRKPPQSDHRSSWKGAAPWTPYASILTTELNEPNQHSRSTNTGSTYEPNTSRRLAVFPGPRT